MQPKISIIIPTLGRQTLYPLVENLLTQEIGISYEIILIPQTPLKEELLKDRRIRIFYEPMGKGFAFYRNKGVSEARGEICVFIDDDEMPLNLRWLETITAPIVSGRSRVVTAGSFIPLGQGYFTNCISLLGFPGGGAIGFETIWPLSDDGTALHVCTGNLAIEKKCLEQVENFDSRGVFGNEDVILGDKLVEHGVKITYESKATVNHAVRRGFLNFIQCNILRGKSAAGYLSQKPSLGKIAGRIKSSLRVLSIVKKKHPRNLPGVLWLMANQYFWQGAACGVSLIISAVNSMPTERRKKCQTLFSVCMASLALYLIAKGVYFVSRMVLYERYNQDEYQHTHIAWNILNGKVIFRDFFETHGPLGAWLNAFWLKLKPEPVAAKETLLFLRNINFSIWILNGLLIFICSRALSFSFVTALASSAVYFQLVNARKYGFMIRPDIYVGALSLTWLYLWLHGKRFFSGVILGLAVAFHPKFLPFNLAILLADGWIEWKNTHKIRLYKWRPFLGELSVAGVVGVALLSQRALHAAFHHLILLNFDGLLTRLVDRQLPSRLHTMLQTVDRALWLGFILGFAGLLVQLGLRKVEFDRKNKMMLVLAISSIFFLRTPVWDYALLMVLPFMIVFLCFSLTRVSWVRFMAPIILLYVAISVGRLGMNPPRGRPALDDPNFTELKKMIDTSPRTEPVFFIWYSRCPAYIFNADPEHDWVHYPVPPVDRFFSRALESKIKPNRERENPVRFSQPSLRYVVIEDNFLEQLGQEERQYLEKYFDKEICLWSRKN